MTDIGRGPTSDSKAKDMVLLAVGVLQFLAGLVLAVSIAAQIFNSLGNFLHAPIGIKDNPPPPDAFTSLAELIIIPSLIAYVLLRILKWALNENSLGEVLFGTVLCAAFGIGGLWALQSRFHFEIIPGSTVILKELVTLGVAVATLGVSGFLVWATACEWRNRNWKGRLGIALICCNLVFAIFAVVELLTHEYGSFLKFCFIAGLFIAMGIKITPTTNAVEPKAEEDASPVGGV